MVEAEDSDSVSDLISIGSDKPTSKSRHWKGSVAGWMRLVRSAHGYGNLLIDKEGWVSCWLEICGVVCGMIREMIGILSPVSSVPVVSPYLRSDLFCTQCWVAGLSLRRPIVAFPVRTGLPGWNYDNFSFFLIGGWSVGIVSFAELGFILDMSALDKVLHFGGCLNQCLEVWKVLGL